ncbi:antirestriction protein [Paraburkholderia sp. SIMBA_054]|uniref:antirestriction protein n=1 Tax=Paraburkholderia sp. SIMBA_054 TaxID=3085795 RepID=UPI00397A5889
MKSQAIEATQVADEVKLMFLPAMFGPNHMINGESRLFALARAFAPEHYTGGEWLYFDLSNGGHYAAPKTPERLTLTIPEIHFERDLSNHAAGIVICLFALGQMAGEAHEAGHDADVRNFVERYEQLLEFVSEHDEREAIRAAID